MTADSPHISSDHQGAKKDSYWENLTAGGTAAYKERQIDLLLSQFGPKTIQSILDIGCGTCDLIFRYQDALRVPSVTCLDYDPKVIDQLRNKYPDRKVDWVVGDVFALSKSNQKFDLIFLLDMIHEVYSFYGRIDPRIDCQVDHARGLEAVGRLLDNVAAACSVGGAIVITDNILCEQNHSVLVRMKSPKTVETVRYFFENYPTKKIDHCFEGADLLRLNSRDFCILLTQYNKIRDGLWDRWNVEKMEIHQYFCQSEYIREFERRGFTLHLVPETPPETATEWAGDFEVLEGLSDLPPKRVTLLALHRPGT
jgi:SAM-dependent methyltransferase